MTFWELSLTDNIWIKHALLQAVGKVMRMKEKKSYSRVIKFCFEHRFPFELLRFIYKVKLKKNYYTFEIK